MTEPEFRRALRLGHGRAVQFAMRCEKPMPYREALLSACIECQTYDPQIDGHLIDFTWKLINLSGEEELYRNHLLQALPGCGDDYHAEKRFGMAACFAAEGDDEMREAMYRYFQPGPRHGESVAAFFVHLDGLDAFRSTVPRIGEGLYRYPKEWDFGYFLSVARSELGEDTVEEALSEAAQGDVHAARFLQFAKKEQAARAGRSSRKQSPPASFDDLRARIEKDPRSAYVLAAGWSLRASDSEFEEAARRLSETMEAAKDPWLVEIFAKRPFPLDPAPLIALAESGDRRAAFRAMRCLSLLQHSTVRGLALRLVADDQSPVKADVIPLLSRNFQPGDHAMVLEWLNSAEDDPDLHSLALDALDFMATHPDAAKGPLILLRVYNDTPCMHCRKVAVARMIELNCLPTGIAEECRFDGNDEIRDLIAGWLLPAS